MTDYELLNAQLAEMVRDVPHRTANLANASALLYDALQDLNWAGFYLMENGKLVLGPFQGKVACVEIEVGKGKFTAYNGSEKTNVGLTVTFTDLPTPKPTPRPTPKPTKAPRPKKTPKPTSKPQVRTESTHSYVLNTKTRKFHYATCSDVGKMNSENRQNYSGSRSQVIGMGYSPCGHCNP